MTKRNFWIFSYNSWIVVIFLAVLAGACNKEDNTTPEPDPVAAFSFSPTAPKAGEQVTFSNTSQNADSFTWSSSPSGFSSTDKNPTFTFTTAGTYEITLTAKKGTKTASAKKSITVAAVNTPVAPVADFTFSPASPKAGDRVQFTNASQNATTYEWSSSPAGFTSTDKDPNFTFAQAGTYSVTLKATGTGGNNSVTKQIVVAQVTPAPVANFTFSPAAPKTGERVQFTNTSQNATTYEWSSSPAGFTSTDKDPGFTFTQAGNYTITLKVTGAGGNNTVSKSFTVTQASTGTGDPCNEGCYVTKTTITTLGISSSVTFEYTMLNGIKVPVRISTSNASGTIITDIKYDAQGRRTRDDNSRNGTLANYTTYEYSGNNTKASRSNSYDANGTLQGYTVNQYNSGNLLIRADNFKAGGVPNGYDTYESFTAEGFPRIIKSYDANNALTATSTYEFQGCVPTRIITRDGSGAQISEMVNTVESRNRLRRSTMTTTVQGFTVVSVTDYQYDCD